MNNYTTFSACNAFKARQFAIKLTVLLFCFQPAIAQSLRVNKSLNPKEGFIDEYYEYAPSSGLVVAGVMLNNSTEKLDPTHCYSFIPKVAKSLLCVAITSKDGRYKGAFQYDITNVQSGWFQLNFPTEHREELDKYRSDEIIIVSTIADACSSDNEFFYTPSVWRPDSNEEVVIYLNSSEMVFLIGSNEKGVIELRKPFVDVTGRMRPKSFNKKCLVTLKELKQYKMELEYRSGKGPRAEKKYVAFPFKI
ncbi:hypothetical protein [Salinimicrobium soli]|uniref:hypothetical protein n=1 Tax=Salinimicrobium soli TaxID=1254399 RepID=UPI003AABC4CF